MERNYTRADAWKLLIEYTASPSLRKHALAVETCLRAYGEAYAASHFIDPGERQTLIETYSITGLLHDFDYEQHPSLSEHPYVGVEILAEQGWDEDVRHAILAHADYTGTPRVSHLDKGIVCLRRAIGFSHSLRPHQAIEVDPRCGCCGREEKAEGQSVRAGRES